MANLINFKQMLADVAEQRHGLPQICLKGTTELEQLLDKLVTVDNRKEDESDGQVTMRYIDELCEKLGDPDNEDIVNALNTVVIAFKDKIVAATTSISDIRETAKTLAGYMETLKNDILAKDPFVASHLKLTTLSTDFPEWTWSGPSLIGSNAYIAERINAKLSSSEDNIPQSFDYRTLTNNLLYVRKENPVTSVDGLSSEELDAIVESATEIVGESTTVENIKKTVDILCGISKINSLYTELENIAHLDPALLFKTVQAFDGYIHAFYPTAEAIASDKVALPEASKDAILANARSLVALCERFAYFELMERETVMRQSILLQGGLVNADVKAEYEAAGGTQLMLAHYIRFMYKDDVNKIPSRGIPVKVIVESAAHNEKVVKESMTNVAHRIAIATTRARVDAFKTVANRFVVQYVERTNPDAAKVDLAVKVTKIYECIARDVAERILHHDISFVDAALILIVRTEYTGTFVEQMFNALGAKYIATAEAASGEVTALDLRIAEMDVVSSMVSDFIVKNIVVTCNCKDMTMKSPIVPAEES